MGKKSRQKNQDRQARQISEALKAQAATQSTSIEETQSEEKSLPREVTKIPQVATKYIKSDLLKSMVLTVVALGLIALAYFLLR